MLLRAMNLFFIIFFLSSNNIFLLETLESTQSFFIDDIIYSSVNWLYTYVESNSIFNVIFYSLDWNSFLSGDSFDFFFYFYWFLTWNISNYQLFWSDILSHYINFSLLKMWFNDEWFRSLLSSQEFTLLLVYHPEIFYLNTENIFFGVMSKINVSILDTLNLENYYLPVFLFPQLLLLLFVSCIFITFYFSFFNSSSKEENTVDFDFLAASLTVEAEKEITAIDDILMGLVVVVYIFFWFFYIHCWSLFSVLPELGLVFYLFPLLWVIVLGVPVFLLYDFGIFFVTYLRGVGPTPVFIAELMYDYIGVLAFFIRLVVQGVRIVLMTLTYVGLHDFIIFHIYDKSILLTTESFWDLLNSLDTTKSSISFYLLGSLPLHFFHWIYELFHTFFVVTAQTTAFFAMAFWLFLFLYSFFVSEKHENYFFEKRNQRISALDKIINLKKN